MKPLTLISMGAFLLFTHIAAFGQDKNITIITDDNGESDFFAFMPEMPMIADLGSIDIEMDMGSGIEWADEREFALPLPPGAPDDLNLSKEQIEKIKKIQTAAQKLNIPLKSDMELKQMELKDLMSADPPDKNAISAKVKEMDALRTQIKLNRINSRIDCRNVLTKEQKDKMEQMRAQRKMMFFDGGKRKMKFKHKMFCE